jgi:uncharacterized protein (DUF849 family)
VNKVIITAALTGAVTVPTQTPYLPYTIEQLAEDAEQCARAGAAIIHIHARNPANGAPSSDMELFGEILKAIKARTDAVICTTTGGGVGDDPGGSGARRTDVATRTGDVQHGVDELFGASRQRGALPMATTSFPGKSSGSWGVKILFSPIRSPASNISWVR